MQLPLKEFIRIFPFPLSVFDSKGKLVITNNQWNEVFTLYPKKNYTIANITFLKKTGMDLNIKAIQKLNTTIKSKPVHIENNERVSPGKDISRYYAFHINNILDNNKKYTIVLAEDVTEERKHEDFLVELAKQAQNSAYILEVLENERKRIAKDLHDVIGQKLIVAKLNLEYYQKQHDEKIPELEKTKEHIQEISKEIKMIIQNLHPVIIDKYSLTDALNVLVQNFMMETGVTTTLKFFGDYKNENKTINLNIYRIIQEALNNITKHSSATEAKIELHFITETVTGMIEDNGEGFNDDAGSHEQPSLMGYGIISMRERAKACGGDFSIEGKKGKGTKVIFNIPMMEEEDEK